jgi:outer membrane protein OmpA-like peptidoglycan-associated protein
MNTLRNMGIVLFLSTAGCASVAPTELLRARSAYQRASQGQTAELNPAGLHGAKQSLDVAEHSFAEEGDSQETKDLAYNADNRAQTAEARARELQLNSTRDMTLKQMHDAQTAQVKETSAELGRARSELGMQGQMLTDERARRADADARRIEAEARAAAAAAALAGFATVKQEPRGMVISLSGSVLFASDKDVLLPSAMARLNDVATALNKASPSSKMVVEGHADSTGAEAHNQDLSQRRAQAVRTYLVSRGISADRITSAGFGQSRPVADNASIEGRANNRRVEIVVLPTNPNLPGASN